MLKILRDNIKYLSWILWLVILVFVVFVFVDFGGGLGQSGGRSAVAATVGDDTIRQKDFERAYRQLEDRYREAFGAQWNAELAEQMRLPLQALEGLVERSLMLAEARRHGLTVGDRDVQRAILAMPGLKDAAGKFIGEREYARRLGSEGYSTREFENAVRDDLLLQRFSTLLASSVAVSEAEVERTWRERNERVAVRYVSSPATRHRASATVDRAALESYFAAHAEEFRLPDQRLVDYLLVDQARLRAGIEIPAEQLESVYRSRLADFQSPEEVHARHILIKVDDQRDLEAARAEIAEIRTALERSASFEQLAGERSEDPGSRARGGDLGFFGRGAMVPEFEEAAFSAAPGAVVGPIETSFGLHLIEIVERREARTRPLEEVAGALRAELAAERAASAAEERARALAARLEGESPKTLEEWRALADGDAVVLLTTPKFGRDDVVPGIGRDADFIAAAFALEPGAASAPVEVPRGWAILRLREAIPAHLPELAEVEAQVRAAAERAAALDLARQELERIRAEVGGGRPFDEAAAARDLELGESGEIGRQATIDGLGDASALAAAALALDPGQLGGPIEVGGGAVLFEVVSKSGFDAARFAAEKASIRESLERAELGRLVQSVIARRREQVGVRFDPFLVEQLGLGGDPAAG
jgi:peptidyl-prolyl cis-trans isomerase D